MKEAATNDTTDGIEHRQFTIILLIFNETYIKLNNLANYFVQ